MRAEYLRNTLTALFDAKRTVCIEGPPGGGKTSIVRQVARELDVHYIERHLPTSLVEDFGIPNISGDTLAFMVPDWFPAKGSRYDDGRGGILCFDDRNQASNDLQKLLANICQAKTLHGVAMADGWQVISTGNRQADRAGANRVLSHLRNRETVLELDTHLDDWRKWALENNVVTEVVSFIGWRPQLLHKFDADADCNPTPRSWVEGVSDVLGIVPKDVEYECFAGAIGEGAASEFVGFMRIFRKLPNPDAVLLNPESADVPTDPATLHALAGAIAERISVSNIDRAVSYLERLSGEFGVLAMSRAIKRDPELQNTKGFTDWAINNQDLLF